MKKIIYLTLLLFVSLTSCTKDETEDNSFSEFFKLKIDNNEEIVFEKVSGTLNSDTHLIFVKATLEDGKQVTIKISENYKEGTTYSDFVAEYYDSSIDKRNAIFGEGNGSEKKLKLTKFDKDKHEIAGQFSLLYLDEVPRQHEANGTFSVKYEVK